MAADLIVFVCEGPTCKDRWETQAPRTGIAAGLAALGLASRVRLEREICLGHCRLGPNACAVPAAPEEPPGEGPMGAAPTVLHGLTVAGAVDAIAGGLAPTHLGVAANSELA